MDRIELRGMVFRGRHGVSEAERSRDQDFTVDVEVDVDLREAGATDRLDSTVDYRELRALARSAIEGESVKLIETLAARIADAAVRLDGVDAVSVRIAKRPPSMEPIEAAAVRVNRKKT